MGALAATGIGRVGDISPELVLVDPELAESAQALLGRMQTPGPTPLSPAKAESPALSSVPPAPLVDEASRPMKPNVFPVPFPDNGRFLPSGAPSETLERLLESESVPKTPEPKTSPRPHFSRAATLVPAISAAGATMLLLAQLYLSGGNLS